MDILLNAKDVIDYYSNHGVRSTLKKFNITYTNLKKICKEYNFVKTKEQIRESYTGTRIEKYGSIEKFIESRRLNSWVNRYNSTKENKDEK